VPSIGQIDGTRALLCIAVGGGVEGGVDKVSIAIFFTSSKVHKHRFSFWLSQIKCISENGILT